MKTTSHLGSKEKGGVTIFWGMRINEAGPNRSQEEKQEANSSSWFQLRVGKSGSCSLRRYRGGLMGGGEKRKNRA